MKEFEDFLQWKKDRQDQRQDESSKETYLNKSKTESNGSQTIFVVGALLVSLVLLIWVLSWQKQQSAKKERIIIELPLAPTDTI